MQNCPAAPANAIARAGPTWTSDYQMTNQATMPQFVIDRDRVYRLDPHPLLVIMRSNQRSWSWSNPVGCRPWG